MSQSPVATIQPQQTQWGEVLVAQDHIQSYREGHYGVSPLWEEFAQIDGSDANNATSSESGGRTEISTSNLSGTYGSGLPVKPAGRVMAGQNKNESARIEGDVGFTHTKSETFSVWTEDIGGNTSTAQITVTWSETL